MMRQRRVRIMIANRRGIDVHRDRRQLREGVQHVVSSSFGYFVGLAQGQVGLRDDHRFGVNRVADPASAHSGDLLDAFGSPRRGRCLLDQLRVDG